MVINKSMRLITFIAIAAALAAGGAAWAAGDSKCDVAAAAACAKATAPPCPKCNSNADVIPIVYGYPGDELIKASERGEVALGG